MQLNGTIAFQKPKIGKGITNKNLMKIGGGMASK
jgi:hypothetical protein